MADTFTVIGQRHESQLQPDGTRMAVVVVKYQTKTDPPTVGEVSVPAALLKNPQNYAATVQSEIQTAVDSHNAVANLQVIMTISVSTAIQIVEQILEHSNAGFTSADVSTIILPMLTELDNAKSPADAVAILKDIAQVKVPTLGFAEQPQILALFNALATAYTTKEVDPDETINAVAWVLTNGGIEVIAATTQSNEALDGWFALWAVEQEKPVTAAPPTVAPAPPAATVTTPGIITVAPPVPEPTSPGGKIVTAAEKLIKRASVSVPGLSAPIADGISKALALTYEDTLAITVSVTNQVESDITSVEAVANKALVAATQTATALQKLQDFVDNRLHIDEQRISNILSADQTFQTDLTNLQNDIDDIIDGRTKLTEYATTQTVSALQSEENATQSDLSNYAMVADVNGLQSSLDGLSTEVHLLELALIGSTGLDVATALLDLETEVADAAAVTSAITEGGATVSLLGRLGALLGIASLLTIAGSIVSTIIAVFALDDSIVGTVWSADHIAPIAEAAANVALADVTWSDQVATGGA